jgi:glycosyltransferase involved in cell wall biosynthesis
MKILYFSPHPDLKLSAQTGYGTHMREMILAFQEMGHEVLIFVAGEEKEINGKESYGATPILRRKSKDFLKWFVPKVLWETLRDLNLLFLNHTRVKQLGRICATYKPDLIYERCHYGMTAGVKVSRRLGIYHILEVNSPNVKERIKLSGLSLLVSIAAKNDRWILTNSNRVLVVSTRLAEMLKVPELASSWAVTPNAIRPGQEKLASNFTSREKLQIPENTTLLGFVGSIFPWHGIDLLIEAIAELRAQNLDYHAIIVGDGITKQKLEQKAESLGVAANITWTGAVPACETYRYSELCDILVMPCSNEYGSPVKIFEYALTSIPVIAPQTAPVMEVMEQGVHGILVQPHRNGIIDAILRLRDYDIRDKLASHWKRKVLENHTWSHNARRALEGLNP